VDLPCNSNAAPKHGAISCLACFPEGSSPGCTLEVDGWRIDNNPGYWGARTPEVLVLGFSKGANQRKTLPFDRIAFNNARSNLHEILSALRFIKPDANIDACFTSAETKIGFASVVRCGLGKELELGKYATSGDVVRSAISPDSPVRRFFDGCTKRFLGKLPESVRVVVFLGLDRPYVEAVFERMRELHPSIRRLSELAYSTASVTFIHVVHPSPLATSHRQAWLRDGASSLSANRREVCTAIGLQLKLDHGTAHIAPVGAAIAASRNGAPSQKVAASRGAKPDALVETLLSAMATRRLRAETIENKRGKVELNKLFRIRRADGEEFAVDRTVSVLQIWSSVRPKDNLQLAEPSEEYESARTRHSNLNCMPRLCGPHGGKPGVRAWKLLFNTLMEAYDFVASAR
jgi:hypothetical protein